MTMQSMIDTLTWTTNVVAGGALAAGYKFDAVGNLQSLRYGNNLTNLCQYDALNRLTNSVWNNDSGLTQARFAYQLMNGGTRTNLVETVNAVNRTYAWSYDNLYRLTNEVISATGSIGYGYDPVGNRINRNSTISGLANQTSTYNTNDWLSTDKYDANGSTTNSGGNYYQYDEMNHLINVNNGQITYIYDGDGNRVSKTVGNTTIYYLIDDCNPSGYAQVVEEWANNGDTALMVYTTESFR